MSTCLSLVHGYIFLLYVYLFNKDVCWEIAMVYLHHLLQKCHNLHQWGNQLIAFLSFLLFYICMLFNVCIKVSELSLFFKVCCSGWTREIIFYVHLNVKVLKELGNALTDVCIFWLSFPRSVSLFDSISCQHERKILYRSQEEQKGMEEKDVCAENWGGEMIMKSPKTLFFFILLSQKTWCWRAKLNIMHGEKQCHHIAHHFR